MNEFEQECHRICQQVLKRHYQEFKKDIKDGFFYNTPTQGQRRLTDMLGAFRRELETRIPLRRHDTDAQVLKETIMGEYMQIGRTYGERVLKKSGLYE